MRLARPSGKVAVVTENLRRRQSKREPEFEDVPEADARVKAFFARMIRLP
jgi:hypothetical protein